jgi:hypothetical protein
VIDEAARIGLLDYVESLRKLETTNFHISKDHLNSLITSFQQEQAELERANDQGYEIDI